MSSTPHLSTLSARLKILRNPTFKLRYFYRNIDKARQAFLIQNYKACIRRSPLRAIYLLPLLILRKAVYTLESYAIKAKLLTYPLPKPPRILGVICLPLWLLQKLSRAMLTPLSSCIKARIYTRFLLGKVDMPYFELVLTTRCSLRCESCNNLMQYFDSHNAYTCTLEGISQTLTTLLGSVDAIYNVRIIGGEPLLFKDIAEVVKILDSSKKVKSFDIVTNATIIPKPSLLEALQASTKCFVSISDYTKSPNLTTKLHIQKLLNTLQAHKIPHYCLWQDDTSTWFSPGKIYKRGRTKEGIIDNFLACLMPCVSVMSHESIPRNNLLMGAMEEHSSRTPHTQAQHAQAQNPAQNPSHSPQNNSNMHTTELEYTLQSAGEMFICPIASSLSRLKGLEEFAGDFISLDSSCDKYTILSFYAKEFFKACDYCHDMAGAKESIPIAVQTNATLELTP